MTLAIFDLDNTLLDGDSDHAWGEFLCDKGLVDRETYRKANDLFFAQYQEGTLDINEFLAFALQPLSRIAQTELDALHQEFMQTQILPMITPASRQLLAKHRAAGDFLLIITATNRFVTEPIAAELGVDALLATEPDMQNGKYTGKVSGTPCFQAGKVQRLKSWLQKSGYSLNGSHFYSDSINDLPLLEAVEHPVAVNPDDQLQDIATTRNWPIMSLRAQS